MAYRPSRRDARRDDMMRRYEVRGASPFGMDTPDSFDGDDLIDLGLGIDEPELDDFEESEFEASGLDRFLERLGAGGMPDIAPQGFAQGLATGLVRTGVGRGQRVSQRRQKFETGQAKRAAERDQANLQATRDYRRERGAALKDMSKSQREDRRRQQEYERDNPIVDDAAVAANPGLARIKGQRVPVAWLKPADPADAARETRRQMESDRDYNLRVRGENRQAASATRDATGQGKPLTEAQSKDVVFVSMGRNAVKNAQRPVKVKGKAYGSIENYFVKNPGALWELRAPNIARSPEARAYAQAIGEFAQAFNRKLSGGAVTPEEWTAAARDYFAQPGDDENTIAQKAASRENFLSSMEGAQPPAARTPPIPATWKKVGQ